MSVDLPLPRWVNDDGFKKSGRNAQYFQFYLPRVITLVNSYLDEWVKDSRYFINFLVPIHFTDAGTVENFTFNHRFGTLKKLVVLMQGGRFQNLLPNAMVTLPR